MKTAKLFQNGQSQAVRLPKEFRFEDDHVFVKKTGNVVVLIPAKNSWETLMHSLDKFSDDFMAERKQPKAQSGRTFDEVHAGYEYLHLPHQAKTPKVLMHFKSHAVGDIGISSITLLRNFAMACSKASTSRKPSGPR